MDTIECEYDYVILTRPDIFIIENSFSKYINNISDNSN